MSKSSPSIHVSCMKYASICFIAIVAMRCSNRVVSRGLSLRYFPSSSVAFLQSPCAFCVHSPLCSNSCVSFLCALIPLDSLFLLPLCILGNSSSSHTNSSIEWNSASSRFAPLSLPLSSRPKLSSSFSPLASASSSLSVFTFFFSSIHLQHAFHLISLCLFLRSSVVNRNFGLLAVVSHPALLFRYRFANSPLPPSCSLSRFCARRSLLRWLGPLPLPYFRRRRCPFLLALPCSSGGLIFPG